MAIILFELNEVPFRIVDEYCRWHPDSTLARTFPAFRQYRTLEERDRDLTPWRTWPSLHRGVSDARHGIQDFGQELDEANEAFPPVWRILAEHGVSTGVSGSLHSSPMPRDLNGYRFYIPDTFAAGSECFPATLGAAHEFSLRMAQRSLRNVDLDLAWGPALRLLAAAPELGLKPRTFGDAAWQLAAERLHPPKRTRRRSLQAVLAFDVFLAQLERTRPAFATFFTNHVAASLHRYWAARFPDDYDQHGFDSAWVATYRDEIDFAMGKFDHMLARLVRFVDRRPDHALWIATGMGQAATRAEPIHTQVYVDDVERLAAALGLAPGDWFRMPAMFPQINFRVRDGKSETFRAHLAQFRIAGTAVGYRESRHGFFSVDLGQANLVEGGAPLASIGGRESSLAALGLTNLAIQDQSGTTAFHVPEGCLLVYDPSDRAPRSKERPEISILEIAPTILRHFAVPVPGYMHSPARVGARAS